MRGHRHRHGCRSAAIACSNSPRRMAVSNRSSSRSWTTFDCNSASSMASRAIALAPCAPSNSASRQLSRPGIGETLQWRRQRGALLDEDLRIAQPERHGMGEMRHRLVHAAERLVGDGDIVVGDRIGAVEFERLAEQLHRQFVAAALLHHVAQQHEAAQVAGIAAQRQAAKIFRLDELAFAVMRYSCCVNIVGFGGLKRAVGRGRRRRRCGLFGRCSSRLPVHFCSVFKRLRTDPARLIRPSLGDAPRRTCLYDFYAISRVNRPIGVLGAGNIVAVPARCSANGRPWRDRQWLRSMANFGRSPRRHEACRALFAASINRRVIARASRMRHTRRMFFAVYPRAS